MPGCVHSVVQDANNRDPVARDAKIKHVPFYASTPITWPDVIAGRGRLGPLCQFSEGCRHDVDVAIGLVHSPLQLGVSPDGLNVALSSGRYAILSHASLTFVV